MPSKKDSARNIAKPWRLAVPLFPLLLSFTSPAMAKPPVFPYVASRLQDLGYLPLTPAIEHLQDGKIRSFYFFRFPVPASLQHIADQYPWNRNNPFFRGALIQFERQNGILHATGISEGNLHKQVIRALAKGKPDRWPWEWVLVDKVAGTPKPETLFIWREGQGFIYHTLVNTGVLGSTPDGTWPIYQRLPKTTMRGVFPEPVSWATYRALQGQTVPQWAGGTLLQSAVGTVNGRPVRWIPYNDPGILWVNYFDAGRGIHYYPRASYGFPQSASCVEEPYKSAPVVYRLLHYGVPVTVVQNVPDSKVPSGSSSTKHFPGSYNSLSLS